MFERTKRIWRAVSRLPIENQNLRAEVARLASTCDRLQVERNMWQELHRKAGAEHMAAQEFMMHEIVRLSTKCGEEADPRLAKVTAMYAEAHTRPHKDPSFGAKRRDES